MSNLCQTPGCNKQACHHRKCCKTCCNKRTARNRTKAKERPRCPCGKPVLSHGYGYYGKLCRSCSGRGSNKAKAVAYLGGSCSNPNCPLPNKGRDLSVSIFDFHHRNPAEKAFGITNMLRNQITWERLCVELDKCDLLCAICHRLHHLTETPE